MCSPTTALMAWTRRLLPGGLTSCPCSNQSVGVELQPRAAHLSPGPAVHTEAHTDRLTMPLPRATLLKCVSVSSFRSLCHMDPTICLNPSVISRITSTSHLHLGVRSYLCSWILYNNINMKPSLTFSLKLCTSMSLLISFLYHYIHTDFWRAGIFNSLLWFRQKLCQCCVTICQVIMLSVGCLLKRKKKQVHPPPICF